jgi:hypothetical protein
MAEGHRTNEKLKPTAEPNSFQSSQKKMTTATVKLSYDQVKSKAKALLAYDDLMGLRELLQYAQARKMILGKTSRSDLPINTKAGKEGVRTLANDLINSGMITPTGLRAEGWTDTLISKFLGDPDVLTKNPHYKSAAPMRLYYRSRVEAESADPVVANALADITAKRAKRQKSSENFQNLVIQIDPAIHWENWSNHFSSSDEAITSLVIELNRLVKRFNKDLQGCFYSDKDDFIAKIQQYCTGTIIANEFQQYRRDYYSSRYCDEGYDLVLTGTKKLYCYYFDFAGVKFSMHSFSGIVYRNLPTDKQLGKTYHENESGTYGLVGDKDLETTIKKMSGCTSQDQIVELFSFVVAKFDELIDMTKPVEQRETKQLTEQSLNLRSNLIGACVQFSEPPTPVVLDLCVGDHLFDKNSRVYQIKSIEVYIDAWVLHFHDGESIALADYQDLYDREFQRIDLSDPSSYAGILIGQSCDLNAAPKKYQSKSKCRNRRKEADQKILERFPVGTFVKNLSGDIGIVESATLKKGAIALKIKNAINREGHMLINKSRSWKTGKLEFSTIDEYRRLKK